MTDHVAIRWDVIMAVRDKLEAQYKNRLQAAYDEAPGVSREVRISLAHGRLDALSDIITELIHLNIDDVEVVSDGAE